MNASMGIRNVTVSAIIIRKDGTREDLGEITRPKNILQWIKRRWNKWLM
jgi:hypothetical protein